MTDEEHSTKQSHIDPMTVEGRESADVGVTGVYIDPGLEKKIVRKFDCYVLPQFVIIILLAYLDRSNLGTGARLLRKDNLPSKG